MARGFQRPWLLGWCVAALAVLGFGACTSTVTTTTLVTTGILVRAETLNTGKGCGRAPTNVFKYAVVVYGFNGQGDPNDRRNYTANPIANLFDCFADGTFVNLKPVAGSSSFRLEVFAYNAATFEAGQSVIAAAVGSAGAGLRDSAPTWTTECTATQQTDVQTVALCDPLGAGLTGLGGEAAATRIALATGSFRLPDGRLATCVTGADAGAPDAGDAGEASDAGDAGDGRDAEAPADAGAPVVFTTARIRYRIGTTLGSTTDVTCPQGYEVEVPAEPAAYTLDVGLLDADGGTLGQTACTVTTEIGATSSATCP